MPDKLKSEHELGDRDSSTIAEEIGDSEESVKAVVSE